MAFDVMKQKQREAKVGSCQELKLGLLASKSLSQNVLMERSLWLTSNKLLAVDIY